MTRTSWKKSCLKKSLNEMSCLKMSLSTTKMSLKRMRTNLKTNLTKNLMRTNYSTTILTKNLMRMNLTMNYSTTNYSTKNSTTNYSTTNLTTNYSTTNYSTTNVTMTSYLMTNLTKMNLMSYLKKNSSMNSSYWMTMTICLSCSLKPGTPCLSIQILHSPHHRLPETKT